MTEKIFKFRPETPEQRIVWEVIFLIIVIIAIGLFGSLSSINVIYTIIITIIFSCQIILRFIFFNQKGDWIFFFIGVLAGGGNDLSSMLNGVYQYTSITIVPFLSGLLPLWMIFFWGQVFLVFRKIFNLKWFKGDEFKKDGKLLGGWVNYKLIFDIIILVILRIAIYRTYYLEWWIPALIYGLIIGIRFLIFRPKKNQIFIIIILPYAFIFEGLMVSFGLYIYINPSFLGMPIWLFLWWIFLVPCLLKEIFDRIEYLINK
ncbi:MAG: hypothetical protein ACTSQO_02230 [Candidatus Helarchaeota archaeon]